MHTGALWIIQHCSTPGCLTAIRVPAGQQLVTPICQWCDKGVSHAKKPKTWPDGMPDPELPWPWMNERDREHKLRLAFWQERFKQYGDVYAQWIHRPVPT